MLHPVGVLGNLKLLTVLLCDLCGACLCVHTSREFNDRKPDDLSKLSCAENVITISWGSRLMILCQRKINILLTS